MFQKLQYIETQFWATKLEKCATKYDLMHHDNNYKLIVAGFEKANETSLSATNSFYCTFQEYVAMASRVQAMSTPGGFADPRHFATAKLLKSNIPQLHFFIEHTVDASTMKTIFSSCIGRNKSTDWESLIQPAKTAALGPLFLKALQAVLWVLSFGKWFYANVCVDLWARAYGSSLQRSKEEAPQSGWNPLVVVGIRGAKLRFNVL